MIHLLFSFSSFVDLLLELLLDMRRDVKAPEETCSFDILTIAAVAGVHLHLRSDIFSLIIVYVFFSGPSLFIIYSGKSSL